MSNGTYDLASGQSLATKISPQIKSEVGNIQMGPCADPDRSGEVTV
jgi:hypothetical protein